MKIDELGNLILHMQGGLLPECLSEDECRLLEKEFGKNWFSALGYTEPEYKRPVY